MEDPPELEPPRTAVNEAKIPELPGPCIQKPTQCVQDLLEGNATWTNRSKAQKVFPGVQLPTADEADVADWATNAIDEYALAAETMNSEALEPQSLKEAQSHPDWKLWEKAIAMLKAAGTWELVDTPEGVNVVGSKWVFRVKKDAVRGRLKS